MAAGLPGTPAPLNDASPVRQTGTRTRTEPAQLPAPPLRPKLRRCSQAPQRLSKSLVRTIGAARRIRSDTRQNGLPPWGIKGSPPLISPPADVSTALASPDSRGVPRRHLCPVSNVVVSTRPKVRTVFTSPDPGHDRPVLEAQHQLRLHPYRTGDALDDADQVDLGMPDGHQVDDADGPAVGVELRLQDQRVAAVTPPRGLPASCPGRRDDPPAALRLAP